MAFDWMEKLGYTVKHLNEMRSCGYLYYKQGQFETATKMFEALKLLDPGHLYDLNMLGALYLQLDDPRRAIENLDLALEIDPTHQEVLMNRFKALLLINQKQTASDLALILLRSDSELIRNQTKALLRSYNLQLPAASI